MNNVYVKLEFNKFKYFFNYVTKDEIDGKFFYILPYKEGMPVRKLIKIIKKLKQKVKEEEVLIFPNELLAIEEIEGELIDVNIFNGKWLFNLLIKDVIEYIFNEQEKKIEEAEVCFLVNDNNYLNLENLEMIAKSAKRVKIVTNNLNRFKFIEEKLNKEEGIAIVVTNNKKKSLAKAKLIINIDFNEELINKYNINRDAIIVNIKENVKIENKSFEGININYYKLKFGREIKEELTRFEVQGKYDENVLYESFLFKKGSLNSLREVLQYDEINIVELIGINGIIDKKEYKKKINQQIT